MFFGILKFSRFVQISGSNLVFQMIVHAKQAI